MTSSPVKRKLAAILSADAYGYSRMMEADEEGTAKILAAHRAIIDGIIEFHEGRIVNTAGDSVLAEFASPIEAVRCAVEIQDALKTRNDALPESSRMQFRIGVNLGDVMVKGEDLLGDGVNVAARLQSIAEPGRICLSSSVYDQIAGKLDLGFVDLGEQSLKNIDRPIRAYQVEREGRQPAPAPKPPRATLFTWVFVGLVAALSAAMVGWTVYQARLEKERAEAKAELEKARLEEERARVAAELEKARAEAEAAKKQAAAAAREAARRKQEAEKAGKKEAAASAPTSRFAGAWRANFACEPAGSKRSQRWSTAFEVDSDVFDIRSGTSGKPGSFRLSGTPGFLGRLSLSGAGIERDKSAYSASFKLKREGPGFSGSGTLGSRRCELELVRAQ